MGIPRLLPLLLLAAAAGAADGFVLTSPEVADGGDLPRACTGDGEGATVALAWSGAPAGTAGYALVMHHLDPEGRTKWYWVLYGIPAATAALPHGVQGIGTMGSNSVNHQMAYAPPHSKGPGAKTYVYTLYALSGTPRPQPPAGRPELLAAIDGMVLASADLRAVYTRPAGTTGPAGGPPPPPPEDRP